MLRAAICDDEENLLRIMQRSIDTAFHRAKFACTLDAFPSGTALLEAHQREPYDILFLDIYMPNQSGFEIAKAVRQQNEETLLIFVTSQDALVYNSLDYRPFQFVRKGKSDSVTTELAAVTRKLVHYFRENEQIELDLGVGERRSVAYREISYLKSSLHYIEYHLSNGECLRVRQSMADAKQQLESHAFVQIHRQYIINLRAIERISVTNSNVRLYSGELLSISKSHYDAVMERYRLHKRETT